MKTKTNEKTAYQKWQDGELPGQGSFHTGLLKLYQLGDSKNQEILNNAFPEWFKLKILKS